MSSIAIGSPFPLYIDGKGWPVIYEGCDLRLEFDVIEEHSDQK